MFINSAFGIGKNGKGLYGPVGSVYGNCQKDHTNRYDSHTMQVGITSRKRINYNGRRNHK